jgi:hypothetical protein
MFRRRDLRLTWLMLETRIVLGASPPPVSPPVPPQPPFVLQTTVPDHDAQVVSPDGVSYNPLPFALANAAAAPRVVPFVISPAWSNTFVPGLPTATTEDFHNYRLGIHLAALRYDADHNIGAMLISLQSLDKAYPVIASQMPGTWSQALIPLQRGTMTIDVWDFNTEERVRDQLIAAIDPSRQDVNYVKPAGSPVRPSDALIPAVPG